MICALMQDIYRSMGIQKKHLIWIREEGFLGKVMSKLGNEGSVKKLVAVRKEGGGS